MKKLAFIITICLCFIACKTNKDKTPVSQIAVTNEGTLINNVYENKEIGWKIAVPKGWKITSNEQLTQSTNKGEKAIEQAYGEDVDLSKTRYLVSFSKDQFNAFVSTLESLGDNDINWQENNQLIKEMIYNTYQSQNIMTDTSSFNVNIDDLSFDVFHIIIRGADKSIVLQQELYSTPINNNYFGVNINYNSEENKKELLDAWLNSKFIK